MSKNIFFKMSYTKVIVRCLCGIGLLVGCVRALKSLHKEALNKFV